MLRTTLVLSIWLVVSFAVLVLFLSRERSPMKEFVAWLLTVWPIPAALVAIAVSASVCVSRHGFHKKSMGQRGAGAGVRAYSPPVFSVAVESVGHPFLNSGQIGVDAALGITAIPNAQVDRLFLKISGKEGPSNWGPREVQGHFGGGYVVSFEIPKGVHGNHIARIVGLFDGNPIESETFMLDVPGR